MGRQSRGFVALLQDHYYKTIFDAAGDPEIKALAKEFVAEESSHVAELQRWIAAHKAGQALPVDP